MAAGDAARSRPTPALILTLRHSTDAFRSSPSLHAIKGASFTLLAGRGQKTVVKRRAPLASTHHFGAAAIGTARRTARREEKMGFWMIIDSSGPIPSFRGQGLALGQRKKKKKKKMGADCSRDYKSLARGHAPFAYRQHASGFPMHPGRMIGTTRLLGYPFFKAD